MAKAGGPCPSCRNASTQTDEITKKTFDASDNDLKKAW